MTLRRRLTLGLIGLSLLFAWVFRLFIIYLNRLTDRFLAPHVAVAVLSCFAGIYLLRLALQRGGLVGVQPTLLLIIGVAMMLHWFWRISVILLDLPQDPNPRVHLHLAGLLILLSGYLAWLGWKGRLESGPPVP